VALDWDETIVPGKVADDSCCLILIWTLFGLIGLGQKIK